MEGKNIYRLIPAQWLAHFADEWMFGIPDWSTRHFEPLPESFWITMMSVLKSILDRHEIIFKTCLSTFTPSTISVSTQ